MPPRPSSRTTRYGPTRIRNRRRSVGYGREQRRREGGRWSAQEPVRLVVRGEQALDGRTQRRILAARLRHERRALVRRQIERGVEQRVRATEGVGRGHGVR